MIKRVLLLLLLTLTVCAQPIVFPGQPFQGLQITLTVNGAKLEAPQDSQSAELAERRYTGSWDAGLQLEGSVRAGDLPGVGAATVQANLFVEGTRVASFEKRVYENKTVSFFVKLPPGTKAAGEAEFFVHAFRQGEDGVRIRGRLQAGQASSANKLAQLLQLYVARIPRGLVGNGPKNNILSVKDARYAPYTCGGYQKQVLMFLDSLRFSKNPAERALLDNLEYGPIEGSLGGHQAVALYETGKDWTTGLALDPWPNQRPESMTISQWSSIYKMVQPSASYSGSAANYPILGGMYQDPSIGAGRLTPEEKALLQSLPKDHYDYQSRLSDYARRVWLRGALQRWRTKGKAFVQCPVEARLVDSSGRITGLKDNGLVRQIPGTEVLLHPQGPGDNWMQFGYDPGAGLRLELTPLASGTARVTVFQQNRESSVDVPLQTGRVHRLSLNPLREEAAPPPAQPEQTLFDNTNPGGVTQGNPQPLRLRFQQSVRLTLIQTYHWNNGQGSPVGSIALVSENGQRFGPWTCQGSPGQGGVPNAFWTCQPGVTVPPGVYEVVVSTPSSWAYNAQSGGQGFTIVRGSAAPTGTSVRDVDQAGLAGHYRITDQARPSERYHADARLLPDGSGWVYEVMNGKPIVGKYPKTANAEGYYPVRWSYDRRQGAFVLDWSCGGKLPGLGNFAGTVQGTTSRFTLQGHWSNGTATTIVLERLP